MCFCATEETSLYKNALPRDKCVYNRAKLDITPFSRKKRLAKMSNSIQRDQQRRALFAQHECQRLHYKCAIKNLSLAAGVRAQYVRSLNKMARNSSLSRVRNRCVLTGRGRGVLRSFRLSRIKYRELASQGLLMGVCKSSW